jgi:hypothetical protein
VFIINNEISWRYFEILILQGKKSKIKKKYVLVINNEVSWRCYGTLIVQEKDRSRIKKNIV